MSDTPAPTDEDLPPVRRRQDLIEEARALGLRVDDTERRGVLLDLIAAARAEKQRRAKEDATALLRSLGYFDAVPDIQSADEFFA